MNDTTLMRLTLVAALLAAGLSLLALLGDAERATLTPNAAHDASSLRTEVDRLTTLVDEMSATLRRPGTPALPRTTSPDDPEPITTPDGVPLAVGDRLDVLEQQLADVQATLDALAEQLASSFLEPLQVDGALPMNTQALFDLALRMQPDEDIGKREHFLWRPHDWLAQYGTPTSWDHSGNTWFWQYELPDAGNPSAFTQIVVVFSGGLTTEVSVER